MSRILLFLLVVALPCEAQMPLIFKQATSSGPFSPTDLPGLVFWHKADALSLSNGDPVSSWTDSSGNSHPATQTGSLRPIWNTNQQNSMPGITTDGTSQYLVMTYPGSVKSFFFVAALKMPFPWTGASADIQTEYGGPSNNGFVSWLFNRFNDLSNPALRTATDLLTVNGVTVTDGASNNIPTTPTFFVAAAVNTSTDILGGVDLQIGHLGGTAFYAQFTICEELGYSGSLSSTDRKKVEAYLGARWGITITP